MPSTAVDTKDKTCAENEMPCSFKLSFIVAGFSKCGTTSLCAMLAQHPQIAFSTPKEPLFFNRGDYESRWDSYYAAFPPPDKNRVFGEGSTFYSAHQLERQTRDAILKHFPDIKLIFVARDPFHRIESGYREFHHSGAAFGLNAPFGIADALADLPALIEDSKYWTRINCYRERIPDERILVVFLEDLKRDPSGELQRCFDHLGVDSNVQAEMLLHLNAGERKYYDSALLRRLRNTPIIGPLIAKMHFRTQRKWFQRLGLRHKFTGPIQWDAASIQLVVESLAQDTHQFLNFYGKPENYWERFAKESSRNAKRT